MKDRDYRQFTATVKNDVFKRLEDLRYALRLSRGDAVNEAVKCWLNVKEEEMKREKL